MLIIFFLISISLLYTNNDKIIYNFTRFKRAPKPEKPQKSQAE